MSYIMDLLNRLNCICSEDRDGYEQGDRLAGQALEEELQSKAIFISPKILIIPFPTERYKLSLSEYLERCMGRYRIWNLSEVHHSFDLDHTIECIHRGFPCLPLHEILETCRSISNWFSLSPRNIAIIHCQSNKSRSLTVLSCYMAWRYRNITETFKALEKISQISSNDSFRLLSPSQKRYLGYFNQLLKEDFPIKRIKIQEVIFWHMSAINASYKNLVYLQVIGSTETEVFASCVNPLVFRVNQEFEGDVLLKCKVLGKQTLFKCMLHTAFMSQRERFHKFDLEYACNNREFPKNSYFEICSEIVSETHGQSFHEFRKTGKVEVFKKYKKVKSTKNKFYEQDRRILNEIFGDIEST